MVKADFNRDYYADLELTPTADVNDIKKQFRKLALKYHPDRNPGRESEVNAKFQTIQSAHEVLTSPEQKSKYDTHRTRHTSRYPSASGVKGNPWQNVSSQFPQPPRRPNMSARAGTSGAARYSSVNVPPAPKTTKEESEARFHAWRNMRPGPERRAGQGTGAPGTANTGAAREAKPPMSETRPAVPPRPVPRTASQRQKADASFGNRKAGFVPRSPVGDEPPVTNTSNYSTTRMHTSLFTGPRARRASSSADPTNLFRDSYLDTRQSTPYQSQGGEKFNPFDGVANMARAKSTREGPRKLDEEPDTPTKARRRSSSLSAETNDFPQSSNSPAKPAQQDNGTNSASRTSTSRFSSRYKPSAGTDQAQPYFSAPGKTPNGPMPANGEGTSAKEQETPGYAPPRVSTCFPEMYQATYSDAPHLANETGSDASDSSSPMSHWSNLSPEVREMLARAYPSGELKRHRALMNAFERRQFKVIQDLISKQPGASVDKPPGADESLYFPQECSSKVNCHADTSRESSFTFTVPHSIPQSIPTANRFMRNSTDNINTRFVAGEHSNTDWQFNAGGSSEKDPARPNYRRSQSGSRLGRRSPTKDWQRPAVRPSAEGENQAGATAVPTGFDAGEWSQKIGSQHFEPPLAQASASPSRPLRVAKKSRPVLKTMGTAGLVDEEETSSSEEKTRPPTAADVHEGMDSPNAMDIDPPIVETPVTPQANGARNIHLEPSRREWRAGSVSGSTPKASANTGKSMHFSTNNMAGSEDNDDFQTNFAEFNKVEPFAPAAATGLGSLSDLKSTLPFESKASPKLPLQKAAKRRSAEYPLPPKAPNAPPTLAISGLKPTSVMWEKYVADFTSYMQKWTNFNNLFVDHYQARRNETEKQRREDGFAWLSTRGDAGIRQYLENLAADKKAREEWTTASNIHEMKVREFMAHRDKMK